MSRPSDRPFAGATLHGSARANAVARVEADVAAHAAFIVAEAVVTIDAGHLPPARAHAAAASLLAQWCLARETRLGAVASGSAAEEAVRDTMIDTLQHIRVCRARDFIRAAFKA